MAASYFLLLAQKKVTQEKGTLAAAVAGASMPLRLREQAPGFAGSTSLCSRRTRAHPARARVRSTRLFLRLLAAAERGPGRAERGSPCRRSGVALDLGSLCDAAKGGRTRPAHRAGAREGSRAFRCRTGCPVSGTPADRSEPFAQRRARHRGRVLFGYFLLHEQEKVTRPPGWRTKLTGT